MSGIPPSLAEIVEDFESISDRSERAEMLIYYGDQFEEVPGEVATRPYPEDHLVPGCESEAYVWAVDQPNGTLNYHIAVENPQGLSAKALAAILSQTVSGAPLEQVAALDPEIVFKLFGRDISMGKGRGLTGMVNMVSAVARRRLESTDDL